MLGEYCSLWLSRYFCWWGMVGQRTMQIHKDSAGRKEQKGREEIFVYIFLVLPFNMNSVSHSVASFCLTCCFHLYIPGKLFLTLENWPCIEAVLCVPATHSSLVPSSMLQVCPLRVLHGCFCCGELTTTGTLAVSKCGWPLSGRLPGSALCPGCWPLLGGASHETADWGILGFVELVSAHWWVGLCCHLASCLAWGIVPVLKDCWAGSVLTSWQETSTSVEVVERAS